MVAAVAAVVLSGTSAAFADTLVPLEGDTVASSANINYGSGARACDARGQAVAGSATIKYNGNDHFDAGETLAVTFSEDAGISTELTDAAVVPDTWSSGDSFTLHFATTVEPDSSGGQVGITVVGADFAVGLAEGSGRPHFQVNVDCDAAPIQDNTPPVITYVLNPSAPDGSNGWYKSAVTLTWTVTENESPGSLVKTGCVDQDIVDDQAETTYSCSATSAGGSAGPVEVSLKKDGTVPELTHPNATIDVCGSGLPTLGWTDNLSGVDDATVTPGSWSQTGSGLGAQFTYTGSAADLAGNLHTDDAETYSATTYGSAFSGVLQPVNADGSSRFKLGSTIPVKFKLMCGTTPVTNAVASLKASLGDTAPDAGTDEAVSTSSATTGNLFRYDATAQQYIFNLSTKTAYGNPDGSKISSFTQGTWTLAINLGDGVPRNVKIQLVK